jgi:hypothetical protein
MPTPTHKTAMMQLRDETVAIMKKLQNVDIESGQYQYYIALCSIVDDIESRFLAIERQQIVDAVEWNYKSNMGEVYYNATFKQLI